mgnify:CR=1 FL=1
MNLREAIKEVHDAAEAHPLTALIMSGNMTPVIYHDMLCNLASVYHAIETRARVFGLLTDLSGIERIDAINQDIAELRQQYNLQPPDSYESVWRHVAHVASLDRDGVLAHMYVQHMGDMYGGQLLKTKLPGSGKRFEFVDRGTEDEVALRNNRAAFERIKLKPRVLNDVSKRDQSITLFGQKQNMPIAIAPTGTPGIMWYEGELELARAAKKAGIPFTLATTTLTAMERIVDEVGGRLWFQLYMYADRSLSRWIAERAKNAGYEALIMTVDSPTFSNREYNLRNGFTIPITYSAKNIIDVLGHPRWMLGVWLRYLLEGGLPLFENYPPEVKARVKAAPMGRAMKLDDALNWDEIRAMRKLWPGTLMIKGVLHPDDAKLAADCGVDGLIVSNHGGRVIEIGRAHV